MEPQYGSTGVPAAPPRKRPVGWIVATVVLAVALAAAGVFALAQTNGLGSVNEELGEKAARVLDLETLLDDAEADLTAAEGELANAADRVDEQQDKLAACDRALDVGVRMDRALHDLVDNALYNRPLAEWTRLWNQYDAFGRQWAAAANGCSGDGSNDFSFD